MTLALAMIALSLLAALAAMWPTLRPAQAGAGTGDTHDAEMATLRAALAENERDRASGRIGDDEADATRAELGRRAIALSRAAPVAATRVKPRRFLAPMLTACLVPLGAFMLYAMLGSPSEPDRPIASREVAPDMDLETAIARTEAHLAQNPDDAQAWATIAPIYRREGRLAESREAWSRALPSLAGTARSIALTEIVELGAVESDTIGEDGRAMLREALSITPDNNKADFLLIAAQEGEWDDRRRLAEWRALIERHSGSSNEWMPLAEQRIAFTQRRLADETAPAGPTAQDVANAAAMDDGERTAMIEDMVTGLAARLETQSDDAEGWLRLVRSYTVLGRTDEAQKALTRAKAAFENDDAVIARLNALEGALGFDMARKDGE